MRFNRWKGDCVQTSSSLYEMLGLEPQMTKRISIVGAGGKTTMAYYLAEEICQKGYRVMIATTTHMKRPNRNYIEWDHKERIGLLLHEKRILTVGVSCEQEKIKSVPPEAYEELAALADVLIIEADGSRRMPVKVPAPHEPVIFPDSDLVIGILGYHSIGRRIEDIAYRPADLAQFLETDQDHVIEAEDIIRIAQSREGLLKHVTCAYQVILNQCCPGDIRNHPGSPFIFCEKETK